MATNAYTGLPEETPTQRAALARELNPWAWALATAAFVTVASSFVYSLAQ
jgi:hypothetical protein